MELELARMKLKQRPDITLGSLTKYQSNLLQTSLPENLLQEDLQTVIRYVKKSESKMNLYFKLPFNAALFSSLQ